MKYFLLFVFIIYGCGKKVKLTSEQEKWVSNYNTDKVFFFESTQNRDTLQVVKTSHYYTKSNFFEISPNSFEVIGKSLVFYSKNDYDLQEVYISVSSENSTSEFSSIYVGNLGLSTSMNQSKLPPLIDTIINGKKIDSVYFFSDKNLPKYNTTRYFKNFFWSKSKGLIAYTTIGNEFFILTNPVTRRSL